MLTKKQKIKLRMKQDNVTCSLCYKLNSHSDPDRKNISWQEPIRLSITNKTSCKRDKSKLLNTILKTKLWLVYIKKKQSTGYFQPLELFLKKKKKNQASCFRLNTGSERIMHWKEQSLNLGWVRKLLNLLETWFLWTEKNEIVGPKLQQQ